MDVAVRVTTPHRPLPRSLEPLADESFPGYLLRLAHRLDLSPARLATVTGLTLHEGVPVNRMLALEPAMAEEFGRMTRLSATEVTGLTLASLSPLYPPLDLAFSGRRRLIQGVFVKENWVFSHASRYCRQCLAGDGSVIQQEHGGAWSKLWRLPVVFACPLHGQLLRHACPTCGDPAHSSAGSGSMLPLVGNSTLHPTQCRNAVVAAGVRRACGHQLAQPELRTLPPSDEREDLLRLQSRLLGLLRSDGQEAVVCFGRETTPARYFVDLRILTCVIVASWPAGRDLTQTSACERLVDRHVRRLSTDTPVWRVRRQMSPMLASRTACRRMVMTGKLARTPRSWAGHSSRTAPMAASICWI
ncbi:MAG: TniQ family protein [Chloroflexi bacterium]|nr:MAG: TniQ family protein [Chloroflexota bacterium]